MKDFANILAYYANRCGFTVYPDGSRVVNHLPQSPTKKQEISLEQSLKNMLNKTTSVILLEKEVPVRYKNASLNGGYRESRANEHIGQKTLWR